MHTVNYVPEHYNPNCDSMVPGYWTVEGFPMVTEDTPDEAIERAAQLERCRRQNER